MFEAYQENVLIDAVVLGFVNSSDNQEAETAGEMSTNSMWVIHTVSPASCWPVFLAFWYLTKLDLVIEKQKVIITCHRF